MRAPDEEPVPAEPAEGEIRNAVWDEYFAEQPAIRVYAVDTVGHTGHAEAHVHDLLRRVGGIAAVHRRDDRDRHTGCGRAARSPLADVQTPAATLT